MAIFNYDDQEELRKFNAFYEANAYHVERKLRVALGEITVFCGEDAMSNTRAAFRKSLELIGSNCFKRVMVINSGPEQRRVLAEARAISPQGKIGDSVTKSEVYVEASRMGMLSHEISHIENTLRTHKFDALIINSWEFASANSRYKEALLFRLRTLASDMGMTIVIYSQVIAAEYRPGKIMRGSLGKLSAIAWNIFPVSDESEPVQPVIQERSEKFVSANGKLDPIRPPEHSGKIAKVREHVREPELA